MTMEAYLSNAFLDRVRRAYRRALDDGARAHGRIWRKIDTRRRDVNDALLADGNGALRAIFADPVATDLYFGTDNLCRSIVGSSDGQPFLKLAFQSVRALRAQYQVERLLAALGSTNGKSVVEIGPGMGHCAFYAFRAGVTDYATIDLPLGMVAHARFLAEALGPDRIWLAGEPGGTADQIKLYTIADVPQRTFDVVLNVDSMTEMSLSAAMDYIAWINRHSRLFLSMNHEVNPFTVASIAHCRLAGKRLERRQVPDRDGYFEEVFLIDPDARRKDQGLIWLKAKTLFWALSIPIRRKLPFLSPWPTPN
jgi:putative sugar O-methyltransferase